MTSFLSWSQITDYDILRSKNEQICKISKMFKNFSKHGYYLGESHGKSFSKGSGPQCLTLTSLEILEVFPSVLFCFDAEELFCCCHYFPCCCYYLTLRRRLTNSPLPRAMLCFLDLLKEQAQQEKAINLFLLGTLFRWPAKPNKCPHFTPHSHVRVMDFSHLTLPLFKINLFSLFDY